MSAAHEQAQTAGRRYGHDALLWVAAWTAFRLWFCTTFELVGDEAYYWLWSKHLDLNYFSKGPGVAWTIALGTRLFGDTVLGIRVFSVLLAAGTAWALFGLARRLFSARVAFWTVVAASLMPLYVAGGMLMTIDPLSVCFWTAAACAFWRAKDSDRFPWWGLTGLLVGLGMLGKYTNVAQIPSFALFCAWSPAGRRHLRRFTFWGMVAVALLCLLPVVVWNCRHQWVTLGHLVHRGALDRPWRLSAAEFGGFLLGQTAVAFPLFFIGMAAAVFCGSFRRRYPEPYRYLLSLALPLFAFYAVLALNEAGPPNWTAPSYVSGVLLMTACWLERADRNRAARAAARTALGLAAAAVCSVLALMQVPLPLGRDPFVRVRGAADLAQQVDELAGRTGARFVITRHYQDASLLSFYLGGRLPVFMPNTTAVANQFALWPGYGPERAGQDAVYVVKHREVVVPSLYEEFESVELVKETASRYKGHPVRMNYLFLCRGYSGEPFGGGGIPSP
jgi:4-amino-4-deoxy-L-arabinose transferase-like glycosyltransferase